VIVFNQNDFQWAEAHKEAVRSEAALFLQPEWSKRETTIPQVVAYIEGHPAWQLSLQTHKYIGLP
jgi:organic radical activating enzyme